MDMDKSGINLLSLIGRDTKLKKASSHAGGEYKGGCPFCGGVDRFWVQPNYGNGGRWSCRNCSLESGDCISYVMRRDGCEFKEAITTLGIPLDKHHRVAPSQHYPSDMPRQIDYDVGCVNQGYQAKSGAFIKWARVNLWGERGKDMLDYLTGRGLNERVIKSAQLGYSPRYFKRTWGETEVHLLPGLIIPTINYHTWQITRIKIRGDDGKYGQVSGSLNSLYIPHRQHQITPGCNVVLVESELDALSLPPGMCVPVATCGNTASRGINDVMALMEAESIILAFDNDAAGQAATEWWQEQLGDKARVLTPTMHDVSEMREHNEPINEWLMEMCYERRTC